MIYFCADDYGMAASGNKRIEDCLQNGILNKVSVLPNGEITDFKQRLQDGYTMLSVHINLIEGRPLSKAEDVEMLLTNDGYFRYSFLGLFLCSVSLKRKTFEKQLYQEIQSQLRFWKKTMGEDAPVAIDSHQHTHMIPLVFKTLMRVIQDEGLSVAYMRIPAEPIWPYIATPSLYGAYSVKGLLKQWLLKIFGFINRKEWKKRNIPTAYFMGAMFSGELNETKLKKLLPHYLKLAEKHNRTIEIGFHPGYLENGETLISGSRNSFEKFYVSPWRKVEYDTLMHFKL